MRIHHLNCGTMCPWGGRTMDGVSKGLRGRLVCHCLLIETDRHGLILVDTGLGLQDVERPYPRLSRLYVDMLGIQLAREETAAVQIRKLGFAPEDVRHIVLTHLDFDHAGGIEDFPNATVHVTKAEYDTARHREGFVGQRRYRPLQWDEVSRWQRYQTVGEPWFGFEAVRDLEGLPPEILLIPLPGHTWGHAGVAIDTGERWLLHAGDAYFYRDEVRTPTPRCTPGLRAYQSLMEVDRKARLRNQQRLRSLSMSPEANVDIFCAHDALEFDGWAAKQQQMQRDEALQRAQ